MAGLWFGDAAGLVRSVGDRFEPSAPPPECRDRAARRTSLVPHRPWRDRNADARLRIGMGADSARRWPARGARLGPGLQLLGAGGVARRTRAVPKAAGVRSQGRTVLDGIAR